MCDLIVPFAIPRWMTMWGLAIVMFGAAKWLSWIQRKPSSAPAWKHFLYLFGWPGMDVDRFLNVRPTSRPTVIEWGFATFKLGLGLGVLLTIIPGVGGAHEYLIGWLGMLGIVLALHFGMFHILSCSCRQLGLVAVPIMNWPIASRSLREFWNKRWNLAFRDLTHRFVFRPLFRVLGSTGADDGLSCKWSDSRGRDLRSGRRRIWSADMLFCNSGYSDPYGAQRLGAGNWIGKRTGWQGILLCGTVVALHTAIPRPIHLRSDGSVPSSDGLSQMKLDLSQAILLVGCGQLCVLAASALVPIRLEWRTALATIPQLLRQLFWVYGGYVVLSIIGLGIICILNAEELASGTRLARSFCAYGTAFWGIRLSLQHFLCAKPFLNRPWLRLGYHLLTVLFATFTLVLGWGVIH